ncbi:HAD family hydrolase [Streptomyces sp. WZ-12]|uniref:HAD family hydrolase n=1 Tax=Streptomyces sp. WZ-12 TaxID=3030210 RepID=UPI0023810F55|nr:HAD family phosphatase [Streptomyces sp. WZ-12]
MPGIVLFDLFGVLACHQSGAGRRELVRLAGVSGSEFRDAYWALRAPYDRGDVDGPGYWRRVADRLGTRFDERRVAELIAADVSSWSAVDDTMVGLVAELAAGGRRLGLLSNIPEELARYYESHHAWLDRFEVRAFSCRIGRAKPEAAAYDWCRRALSVSPERILFVDDREENVRAAEAVGMHGHLFTTPERLRDRLGTYVGGGGAEGGCGGLLGRRIGTPGARSSVDWDARAGEGPSEVPGLPEIRQPRPGSPVRNIPRRNT